MYNMKTPIVYRIYIIVYIHHSLKISLFCCCFFFSQKLSAILKVQKPSFYFFSGVREVWRCHRIRLLGGRRQQYSGSRPGLSKLNKTSHKNQNKSEWLHPGEKIRLTNKYANVKLNSRLDIFWCLCSWSFLYCLWCYYWWVCLRIS